MPIVTKVHTAIMIPVKYISFFSAKIGTKAAICNNDGFGCGDGVKA